MRIFEITGKRPAIGRANDEQGFVLITALLVMLVLTIIGIATTTNTSLELQIAGNDKVHKQTFYSAEAGAIMGAELLEQNMNCVTGFTSTGVNAANEAIAAIEGSIQVETLDFAYNSPDLDKYKTANLETTIMTNSLADFFFPIGGTELTYGYASGSTVMQAGGSLMMAAGYERKGKSAAAGGVSILFDIYSRHLGRDASESIVLFGWRHLVGDESSCIY